MLWVSECNIIEREDRGWASVIRRRLLEWATFSFGSCWEEKEKKTGDVKAQNMEE